MGMIKLDRAINQLESIMDRIADRTEMLYAKIDDIEELADKNNRELTRSEENQLGKCEEELVILNEETEAVKGALDFLNEFVKWH